MDVKMLNVDGGENRFKYRTFSERVKAIRIDINHRIDNVQIAPDDEHDSFIAQSLESWRELNCTQHFGQFERAMRPLVRSLPLVLHNKEKLVELFVRHLSVCNSLAYEPILSLLTMLAKDLRREFYPYLNTILSAVLPLANIHDPQVLEWTFDAVAYLFKYLNRQIQEDVMPVFQCIAPLLGENNQHKPYIRHFAAESFAYLLRKMGNAQLSRITSQLVDSLLVNFSDDYCEGLALLFFETIRHVSGTLYYKADVLLKELLCFQPLKGDAALQLVTKVLILTCNHAEKQHMTPVWNILIDMIKDDLRKTTVISVTNDQLQTSLERVVVYLLLITTCVTTRKAGLVQNVGQIYEVVTDAAILHTKVITSSISLPPLVITQLMQAILSLASALLYLSPWEDQIVCSKTLLEAIFLEIATASSESNTAIYSFAKSMLDLNYRYYKQILLPYVIQFACSRIATFCGIGDSPRRTLAFVFLADILAHENLQSILKYSQAKSAGSSAAITADGLIRLVGPDRRLNMSQIVATEIQTFVEAEIDWHNELYSFIASADISLDDDNIAENRLSPFVKLSPLLTITRHAVISASTILPVLSWLLNQLSSALVSQTAESATLTQALQSLAAQTVLALTQVGRVSDIANHYDCIVSLLPYHNSCSVLLEGIATYLGALRQSGEYTSLFSSQRFVDTIWPTVLLLVSNHNRTVRRISLEIASFFDQPLCVPTNGYPNIEPCTVVHLASQAEVIANNVACQREKQLHFKNLGLLFASKRIPHVLIELVPRITIANLSVHFTPLWKELRSVLSTVVSMEPQLLFDLIFNELTIFENQFSQEHDDLCSIDYPDVWKRSFEKHQPSAIVSNFEKWTKKAQVAFSSSCPVRTRIMTCLELNNKYYDGTVSVYINQYLHVSNVRLEKSDPFSYHRQLMQVLIDNHHLAESKSRRLVPKFKQILASEYAHHDKTLLSKSALTLGTAYASVAPRMIKQQFMLFLELFSKFKHPAQLYQAEELRTIYERLLIRGDTTVQGLALSCFLTFKNDSVTPYEEILRKVATEDKLRETLSGLSLRLTEGSFEQKHRKEVLPVLIRLLFGKMFARKGKSAHTGLAARRTIVLAFLAGAQPQEISYFIDLILDPFEPVLILSDNTILSTFRFEDHDEDLVRVGRAKLVGFLTLLENLFKQIGQFLEPCIPRLFKTLIYVTHTASLHTTMDKNQRNSIKQNAISIASAMTDDSSLPPSEVAKVAPEDVEEEEDDDDDDDEVGQRQNSKKVPSEQEWKVIRNTGIKRLVQVFSLDFEIDFSPYMEAIFTSFISPRVPKLDTESTQGLSTIIGLCLVFSRNTKYQHYLVAYDQRLLEKIFCVLSAKNTQDSVIAVVLSIAENMIAASHSTRSVVPDKKKESNAMMMEVDQKVFIQPYVLVLLNNLESVLSQRCATDRQFGFRSGIATRIIHILAELAVYVHNPAQAVKLVNLLLPGLKKPASVVPEPVKTDILRIIARFLPYLPEFQLGNAVHETKLYIFICGLFSSLKSPACRTTLHALFQAIRQIDASLQTVADLTSDLNSFSTSRLDEPNYDLRLAAFARINENLCTKLVAHEWLPLLHNFVFFIQDTDDISIRNNASFGITKFISQAASRINDQPFNRLVTRVVYPFIKRGVKSKTVPVRNEAISTLVFCVKHMSSHESFRDLTPLLVGGDEEASFFNNINHLQLHRRLRALNRLSEECRKNTFRNSTLIRILLPLVLHFVYDAEQGADPNLVNAAIEAIGAICGQLTWSCYYSVLRDLFALASDNVALERAIAKTIISVLDGFHFDISLPSIPLAILSQPEPTLSYAPKLVSDEIRKEIVDPTNNSDEEEEIEVIDKVQRIRQPMDDSAQCMRIQDIVINKLLPQLDKYTTVEKDDDIKSRVPMALAIVKLLKRLPEGTLNDQLPRLLTKLCQLLRSRIQEARDTTRDTLVKIANVLEPRHLYFITKEMQSALTRGYQLHILGFSVHSLLTGLDKQLGLGDLDHCLVDLASVATGDIFGAVGEEKDAEEYIKRMKELRTNKSYHTFEILARHVGMRKLYQLLQPLKEVMVGTDSAKTLRKVDDVLQRIAIGLNENAGLDWRSLLLFVHGLVTENLPLSRVDQGKRKIVTTQEAYKLLNPAIAAGSNAKHSSKVDDLTEHGLFIANAHKFVEFGIKLFHHALKHNKFNNQDDEQLGMIDPLVDIMGDSLDSRHTQILQLSMKTFSSLARLPLPSLDSALPVVVHRTYKLIGRTPDIKSPIAQAAFQLLTVIMRYHFSIEFSEKQYRTIIGLLRPNLEEPDTQGTTFALIRAIIGRKVIIEEVYDLVHSIAAIMVTSQSISVQQMCRQVYLQFLFDYPQGQTRFDHQMTFMIKNLSFQHESGRTSVMELLHTVMRKFPAELLVQYFEMLFMALVMVMINDESAKCREMSSMLIRELLTNSEKQQFNRVVTILDQWFASDQNSLKRTACQVYGLLIDTQSQRIQHAIPSLLSTLYTCLKPSADLVDALARQSNGDAGDNDFIDDTNDVNVRDGWEVGYYAITTLSRISARFPEMMLTPISIKLLDSCAKLLTYPHTWMRVSTAKLFGVYFSLLDPDTCEVRARVSTNTNTVLYLNAETARMLIQQFSMQLRSQHLSEKLGAQIVKNLFFLAKFIRSLPSVDEADNDDISGHENGNDSRQEVMADNDDTKQQQKTKRHPLFWLLRQLSYFARIEWGKSNRNFAITCVVQFIAAAVNYLPQDEVATILYPIMAALFRITTDESAKGSAASDLKSLCHEILELIQKKVGVTYYHELYNSVRARAAELRQERRQQRVSLAVTNPKLAAQHKLKKHDKKKVIRKRKADVFAANKIKYSVKKSRQT